MMEENIRLARQQIRAEDKKPGYSFVAEISYIFSQMSGQDRISRNREKIRRDLVRIYFDIEAEPAAPAKQALVSQLGKFLRLD